MTFAANRNQVRQGSFQLRWICPRAKKQILSLKKKLQQTIVRDLLQPVEGQRCTLVRGCDELVRVFEVNPTFRVFFVEQDGQYMVIHVGPSGSFQQLPDDGKKIPPISARNPLKQFASELLGISQPASGANVQEDCPPPAAMVSAVAKLLRDHTELLGEASLTEYYFDEVATKLAGHFEETRKALVREVKVRLNEKLHAAAARIDELLVAVQAAEARAATAEAKLDAMAATAVAPERVELPAVSTPHIDPPNQSAA